jgi:preprotein translocase subunit SecF
MTPIKFQVTRQRTLWWAISGVLAIASIVCMFVSWQQIGSPLRPGLDFVGGTRLQLELDCSQPQVCDEPIDIGEVRQVAVEQGLENSTIQIVGQDRQGVSIRTAELGVEQRTQLIAALESSVGQFDPAQTQIDTVGPAIGQQIFTSGLTALIVAFFGIAAYLSLRFQFDYAIFAIIALIHDVLITLGVFSFLGLVANREIDSLFIVALLTIVGFSVNDTVVIYDRVRETLAPNPTRPINDVVDDAVSQTLTRSINTTLTTTLSLIAILLFGGETLKYFALALVIGFILGAYSSIFVASTMLGWWRETFNPAIVPVTEGAGDTPPDTAPGAASSSSEDS